MNASGLYFSNVSENDVRGGCLCRGPTDAGYFSKCKYNSIFCNTDVCFFCQTSLKSVCLSGYLTSKVCDHERYTFTPGDQVRHPKNNHEKSLQASGVHASNWCSQIVHLPLDNARHVFSLSVRLLGRVCDSVSLLLKVPVMACLPLY